MTEKNLHVDGECNCKYTPQRRNNLLVSDTIVSYRSRFSHEIHALSIGPGNFCSISTWAMVTRCHPYTEIPSREKFLSEMYGNILTKRDSSNFAPIMTE